MDSRLKKYLTSSKNMSIFLVLVIIIIIFSLVSPYHRFSSWENIQSMLSLGSEFAIVVLGVGLLMIAGEFDLSVGSILAFCTIVMTSLTGAGMNPFLAGIIVLGSGAVLGVINGVITVKMKIPSFVTTLGAMMIWRGVTLMWSRGYQIPIKMESAVFPELLTGRIGGVFPVQVLWFIGFALLLGLLLHFHRCGNWIFATGDDKESARAMGINTDRIKVFCFAVLGFLCAFAAVIQLLRVGTFSSRAGDGWELRAIAAAVVGGTLLWGGSGSIPGIFWGACIIIAIENGLVVMRIPNDYTYIVYGLIIIFSVLLNKFFEERQLSLDYTDAALKTGSGSQSR